MAALLQKLEEASNALRCFCQDEQAKVAASHSNVQCDRVHEKESGGEVRCYYLSPSTLRHERARLLQYKARNFNELFNETHSRLVGLVRLMRNMHSDIRVKGYVINSLGCLLEQALALIIRMRNVAERVEQIENDSRSSPTA